MPSDLPQHAPRPDRAPDGHRIPGHWENRPDPFAAPAQAKPVTTARPDERGPRNDRWAAVKSAFLFVLAAALLTWMLMTLARG